MSAEERAVAAYVRTRAAGLRVIEVELRHGLVKLMAAQEQLTQARVHLLEAASRLRTLP